MQFSASLDKLAKIITVVVVLLMSFAIYSSVYLYIADRDILLLVVAILLTAVFLTAFLFRPIRYSAVNGNLTIHRLIKNVEIAKSEIQSVRLADKNELDNAIRSFGVGGFFGYFGRFTNSKIGVMIWYCTRRDQFVVITAGNKNIILSPDDPEALVAALN